MQKKRHGTRKNCLEQITYHNSELSTSAQRLMSLCSARVTCPRLCSLPSAEAVSHSGVVHPLLVALLLLLVPKLLLPKLLVLKSLLLLSPSELESFSLSNLRHGNGTSCGSHVSTEQSFNAQVSPESSQNGHLKESMVTIDSTQYT